jgi:carbon-monoxide dehydrogenase small subunit
MSQRLVTITVNNKIRSGEVDVRTTLGDFLRHQLRLTGTHLGCEHGVCGACTVLVDGRSARACLMLAVQAEGRHVETIEGLAAPGGDLSVLQRAFIDHHGLQCGFCTPGMLMTIEELLREGVTINEDVIRDRISGNLCRCTGYQGIVDAALAAAKTLAADAT